MFVDQQVQRITLHIERLRCFNKPTMLPRYSKNEAIAVELLPKR